MTQNAQFICLDPRKTKRARIATALGSGNAIRWIRFVPLSICGWPEADKRAADAWAMSKERDHGPIRRWAARKLLWLQYCGARAMFASRPDAIAVCWNGLSGSRRVFMDGARDAGARTLYFELAPLPGRLTADPCGVNYASGLPRDIAPYRAWLRDAPTPDWRAVGREIQQRRPANARVDVGNMPPLTVPFFFVALQTPGDSQLRLFGGAFPTVELYVTALITAAKRLPSGWHLRIKEHPTANESFAHLLADAGNLPIYFDNVSDTFAQVKAARAVCR